MTRHVTDRPTPTEDALRLREFLRVERDQGHHPAVDALHRKPRGGSASRTAEFARIERGETS